MLNNASSFRRVYIAADYTDLQHGIDGLESIPHLGRIPFIQLRVLHSDTPLCG